MILQAVDVTVSLLVAGCCRSIERLQSALSAAAAAAACQEFTARQNDA